MAKGYTLNEALRIAESYKKLFNEDHSQRLKLIGSGEELDGFINELNMKLDDYDESQRIKSYILMSSYPDGAGVRDIETTIAVSAFKERLVDYCVKKFGMRPGERAKQVMGITYKIVDSKAVIV